MKTNQVKGYFQLKKYNWKDNMLVKKMKWVNDVGKFAQGSKDWSKIERTVYQNLDNLKNLLINLAVKARAERKHGIPNDVTKDIPNDADTWKTNSSLYPVITENQFQPYSKKKLKGHWQKKACPPANVS